MTIEEIVKLLKRFRWNTLERMYGSAHNSIIGFISSEWINLSEKHTVIDGAPSPEIGKGRRGQKNSDILLCKGDKPHIVVEVETTKKKFEEKIGSISRYFENNANFSELEFGLLFMTTPITDKLLTHLQTKAKKIGHSIVFLFVGKEDERSRLSSTTLDRLRIRNDYYRWKIVKIDYWVYKNATPEQQGSLWKEQRRNIDNNILKATS